MTPGLPQHGSSSELEADVMRFMAIIAFCLIAILALVRNVAPASVEAAAAQPTPPQPASKPPAASPQPADHPDPDPVPVPVPAPTPAPVRQTIAEAERPAAAPNAPAPAAQAAADDPPAAEEGLILRFASDGDFLRLIAKGDIRLYAYRDRDVLALSETYRFLESRAPGQVYELLEASIPALVMDAFRQTRTGSEGYRWGVALPGRISRQIEGFVGQVSRGQLVIDRFGDVHHVSAS